VGGEPALPPGPVVVFANHQSFFDGYLLWLVAAHVVRRPFLVWMEEVDRFPFFALQGALPFPRHDPRVRAATIRRTRRLLRAQPPPVLAYFPEGELHDADDPVRPIEADALARLHRALGGPAWWPVAIHATWRGDALPTILLTGDRVTSGPPDDPGGRLERLRDGLRTRPTGERVLLDGTAGAHERWDFSWMRPFFRHRPGRP
jgi:1-acyl-sn-glycerol-3-phosphate acyltransferase